MSSAIQFLPTELLTIIFCDLDIDELKKSTLVCHAWNTIINDCHLFIAKFKMFFEPVIWQKYQTIVSDHLGRNLLLYKTKLVPEQALLEQNIVLAHMIESSIHQQLIQTLTLPLDISPTEFRDYIRNIRFSVTSQSIFINWMSSLIKLYNVPYCFEPLAQDYLSPRIQKIIAHTNSKELERKGHSLYWRIIQTHVLGDSPKLAFDFVNEFWNELDWRTEIVYRSINNKFIIKNADMWYALNWAWVCMHVQDLCDFIIDTIISYGLCHINFVLKHQKLSDAIINKHKSRLINLDKDGKELLFAYQSIIIKDA